MITSKSAPPKNVKEYISAFPPAIRTRLEKMRQTILAAAPAAEEVISYQMPAYRLEGMLVYFAGYKKHIGFYPASPVARSLPEALEYKAGKGTLQFPNNVALPVSLVTKIVKLRVKENQEKAAAKKNGKILSKKTPAKKLLAGDPVNVWMNKQDTTVKSEINAVRKIIKSASAHLSERIKWNAPSYHYNDQDILTFGPYKTNKILLVFHHPAVVKIKSELLQGNFKDRRLVYFTGKAGAEKSKKELTRIITEIIKKIGKK